MEPTVAEMAEIKRRLLLAPFGSIDTPLGPMLRPDPPGLVARITREVLSERQTPMPETREHGSEPLHTVSIECDSDCGRMVGLVVGADDEHQARRIAIRRLVGEGWSERDGLHCRACSLIAAGWSAAPGPNHPASAMSGEFR